MPKYVFVDNNMDVVEAVREACADLFPVHYGNILEFAESESNSAVLSPANADGYMDGGVDRVYLEYFGQGINNLVQDSILDWERRHKTLFWIGRAVIVRTNDDRIPYLISAPSLVGARDGARLVDVSQTLAGMLGISYKAHFIDTVFFPGIGAGEGGLDKDPTALAEEIANSWKKWHKHFG